MSLNKFICISLISLFIVMFFTLFRCLPNESTFNTFLNLADQSSFHPSRHLASEIPMEKCCRSNFRSCKNGGFKGSIWIREIENWGRRKRLVSSCSLQTRLPWYEASETFIKLALSFTFNFWTFWQLKSLIKVSRKAFKALITSLGKHVAKWIHSTTFHTKPPLQANFEVHKNLFCFL